MNKATYEDGTLAQYLGLENKHVTLQMKTVGATYLANKLQVSKAATLVRTSRTFTKLYIQYTDRYFEALTSKISMENTAKTSRTLDYTVEFETKPWLISDYITTITGAGTMSTVGRTTLDGGWAPAYVIISGTDVTVSGYTQTGQFAGHITISGSVTNFAINSETYTSTDNTVVNPDFALYVGPGVTTYDISNASSVTISWRNRWYL